MVERIFCKRTGKLAHYGCFETIKRKVPKDKVFEICSLHKKLRIKKEKIEIYYRVEDKYKLKNGKHDLIKALKEKFIREQVLTESNLPDSDGSGDPQKLSKLIYQVKKSIERHILKKIIFYRLKTMNKLHDEIKDLFLEGKVLNNKVLEELIKKHHLYGEYFKEIYGDPKKIIKEYSKSYSEEIRKMPPEEIKPLRLFKEQRSSVKRRIRERPKPFEFNESHVSAAREEGILSKREYLVLIYRYNLGGQRGTNSLRLVANWLGISHTAVRNNEIRALKKMKDHMEEIKEIVSLAEKQQRRDITPEEYKKKFGYYPLDK